MIPHFSAWIGWRNRLRGTEKRKRLGINWIWFCMLQWPCSLSEILYNAVLCWCSINYDPVSVSVCFCHKSSSIVLAGPVELVFGMEILFDLSYFAHTHTHPFNGPFSGTTQVSQYQKGKTNLDFTEARDSEWQWHQLEHMQVCISLQTANHASTPPLSFLQAGCPSCHPTVSKHWRHTSYHKEIRVSAKIRVLPSGIFS